jgi:hypothetical protein
VSVLGTAADVEVLELVLELELEIIPELVLELLLVLEVVELDVVLELELFEERAIPATTAIIRIARTAPIITLLEIACLFRFICKLNQCVAA